MTAYELTRHFDSKFHLSKWPSTFEVDAETYANCCQTIFNYLIDKETTFSGRIQLIVGMNNGLLFKGVELIYKMSQVKKDIKND